MNLLSHFRIFTTAVTITAGAAAMAEAPAKYYNSCENKGGKELLISLYNTISDHTNVGYDGLWNVYKTSDVHPDGSIWDIYSTKEWGKDFMKVKCGEAKLVGDCVNREHSFPKSWFGGKVNPMYADAFHLYPSDGKVNSQRGNYPYGECSGGTQLKPNGSAKPLGRLGTSTFSGYSGTVFEPDDQYKGDLARSYFYMAACYYDKIGNWNSDMLAGNNYPAFKPWAVELLLKWHRQDPVSDKETKRNDAIYEHQHNRNPFIDHPEMVEYIWGKMQDSKWSSGAAVSAEFTVPVDGSTTDMGTTAKGFALTQTITVRANALTSAVSVSMQGAGYSVSPTTLQASAANAGTSVTVTFNPAATGTFNGKLTLTSGDASTSMNLTAKAVSSLETLSATAVTDESFVARWVYAGDADTQGNYSLDVRDDAGSISGYPRSVKAQAGSYEVTGLQPSTSYIYKVSSQKMDGGEATVTTAAAMPSIDFYYDGTLTFRSTPGEPSETAELMIETDNVDSDFSVEVEAPFELSTDKSSWSTRLDLSADDDRMYMRINAAEEGVYHTIITARCGTYVFDDQEVTGVVSATGKFLEDFEAEGDGSYSATTWQGTACRWELNGVGFWPTQDTAYEGEQAARWGKNGTSWMEMADDRQGTGIGTVSFYAGIYSKDADATIAVLYSTDGGATFTKAGDATVSGNEYRQYSVAVNVGGNARIRLEQASGKRLMMDNLEITDYFVSGLDEATADRHLWDAYSRAGRLVVEVAAEPREVAVYALDGTTVFAGELGAGEHTFDAQAGTMLIVVSDDFARRVILR